MHKIFQLTDLKSIASQRAIVFTLICGALGFIVNLFPLKLYSELSLIFGPALSLLVALSVGPRAGMFAALIASAALHFVWDHTYGYLIYVPEAFVVGYLYRKQWNELLAVTVYGLSLGVITLLASFFLNSDPEFVLDFIGTYLLNSFLYTLIASALLWLFSVPKWLKQDFNRVYTLRTQIFTILVISMTIPLAGLSIYETKQAQSSHLSRVKHEISSVSYQIAQRLDSYLKESRFAIQKQAELISLQSPDLLNSSAHLQAFHNHHPSFVTTLIADANGKITAFNPVPEGSSPINRDLSDREYFKQAIAGRVYTSPAIKGRSPLAYPIVAISAPIHSSNKQVVGILEGSLNLELFSNLITQGGSVEIAKQVVILDDTKRIVFKTNEILKPVLEQINWQELPSLSYPNFKNSNLMQVAAITASETLPNNWQVITFYSLNDFIGYSRQKYRSLGLALLIIILIVGSLAAFLSYQINGPISWVLKRTINFSVDEEVIKPIQMSPLVPREMVTLIRAHESAERRLRMAFKSEQLQQLKRARAEKANEAKSDFLSCMSHELRTPLNAISGFSQLLNCDQSLSGEAKSMASEINVASQYLMLLINDILDMSKIESGTLELSIESVDLKSVIDQALPLLNGLAEVSQIKIELNPFSPVMVNSDRLRLKQVIINLVSNAIKYNRPAGSVNINIDKIDNQCCIEISDTGYGIEQSRIDEIFLLFSRLEHEHSNIEGYGIGLSVTHKLITLMGGKIEVRSQLGEGSCFRVFIPLAVEIRSERRRATGSFGLTDELSISPCRVLYIEDNHLNALVMQKAMQRFPQIEYCRESSGQDGIERLKQQTFDFVLLDITLPDLSGFEVLQRISPQLADNFQWIFAVSANAMSDDIDKGLAAGFDAYVTKPIQFSELFGLIQQYQAKSAISS